MELQRNYNGFGIRRNRRMLRCTLWFLLATVGVVPCLAQATETVLRNFGYPPGGAEPYSGVVWDGAGNLYGTTVAGGSNNVGTVYEVTPRKQLRVLYSFTGGADGGQPYSGVILDSSGNLYGTTYSGGAAKSGVVFELTASGQFTVLYNFASAGLVSPSALIRDSAGNLYGTTESPGQGLVYRLDPAGKQTVLHAFTGGTDGSVPESGVISDSSGNLYGTTYSGGTSNAGVVFKIGAGGHESVLYSFTAGPDGGNPSSGVIRDSAGNLYGVTSIGGVPNANCSQGCGVIYKVDATGHETVLYTFTGGASGGFPGGTLAVDATGNLYGTAGTPAGGTAGTVSVVYKLDTSGHETVLYTFTGGADGGISAAGAVLDSTGNLYGATVSGGAGWGVVFEVDSAGSETVLSTFDSATSGSNPYGGVIRAQSGTLYGTTAFGGAGSSNAGVAFMLLPEYVGLHTFTGGADGGQPYAGLTLDSAGNLYGTAYNGGAANMGVVYKIDTSGQFTVLHNFKDGADGANPYAGVIVDSSGNLFGTTYFGGAGNAGVVYKVNASGHESVLYNFSGGADGGHPYAGVTTDSAGSLYGTTFDGGAEGFGVVYKLNHSGQETVLYNFTGNADGNPRAGVILDSAGNLYGTAAGVGYGVQGYGLVYKLDSFGNETVLYRFTGGADGGVPYGGVIRDAAGNLYGTNTYGGASSPGWGVVYELDSSEHETTLYSFTGASGGTSYSGLVAGEGSLFGTTYNGGSSGAGVVFQLTLQ